MMWTDRLDIALENGELKSEEHYDECGQIIK